MTSLTGFKIKTVTFDRAWHVGDLDYSKRKSWSFEGSGLSISLCPEEWRGLARLGASPAWEVSPPGRSFQMVDGYSVLKNKKLMQTIGEWGEKEGLVELTTRYKCSYYDDELEDTVSFVVDTLEAAREEMSVVIDDDGLCDDNGIKKVSEYILTEKGKDLNRGDKAKGYEKEILMSLFLAEKTGMDGVWWAHQYSPETLSLPCGVVFLDKVETLDIRESQPSDDMEVDIKTGTLSLDIPTINKTPKTSKPSKEL